MPNTPEPLRYYVSVQFQPEQSNPINVTTTLKALAQSKVNTMIRPLGHSNYITEITEDAYTAPLSADITTQIKNGAIDVTKHVTQKDIHDLISSIKGE